MNFDGGDVPDCCCTNGHVIKNKPGCYIALSNAVDACKCGHKFIENEIHVWYSNDEVYENGAVWHVYKRVFPIQCHACGRWIHGFRVECVSKEQAMDNFIEAKAKGLMPNGLMEN